jgi:hypothetical protein
MILAAITVAKKLLEKPKRRVLQALPVLRQLKAIVDQEDSTKY